MTAPHYCPPAGICVPVTYRRCRDGDTVEVSLRGSAWVWAVRLLDCWCPELSEPGGAEAKAFAESVLGECDDLRLFLTLDRVKRVDNPVDALADVFGRPLGYLYVGSDRTLNAMLVEMGYATKEKAQ